ncbi:MAG: hypothetical protein GY694_07630 [Gammaproteobacteria bacterium]|nr:hypothetical protein [Gammaproteobacteria bacterium]
MIEQAVRDIYQLLLNGEYAEISQITDEKRLNSEEISLSVKEYGCNLVPYPASIELDVIEIGGSSPREWNVVAPVYTEEEGLSDLSMELTIIENCETELRIELDNIHVR